MATTVAATTLAAKEDLYGGVIVDPEALPTSSSEFTDVLGSSLQAWRAQGKRGIWLKLPTAHSALVHPAVQQGFAYHHAEKDYVMMTAWLPDSPCTLPPNASHQVGVGAVAINERQEILVVMERSGPLKGMKVWKIPTGLVHTGEDLTEALEREVEEETGIRGRFDGVLALRQAHGFAFGKSDMFLLCALKPDPGQDEVKHQESELVDARWLPLQEYLEQPFTARAPLYARIADRIEAYARGKYQGFKAEKLDAGSLRGKARNDLLLWGDDDCSTIAGEAPAKL